jgi:hypothetical protein
VGGWEDMGGVWAVSININDMHNNDVSKGGCGFMKKSYEVK